MIAEEIKRNLRVRVKDYKVVAIDRIENGIKRTVSAPGANQVGRVVDILKMLGDKTIVRVKFDDMLITDAFVLPEVLEAAE